MTSLELGLAWLLLATPSAAACPVQEVPFPVGENTTLRSEAGVYSITGRQFIPGKVSIASQRAITICGRSDGAAPEPAVLEVQGSLELKAVLGGRNVIENLWIELGPECRSLYLANCEFRGSGGIRSSERGPCAAKVYLEFVVFRFGTSLALNMTGGEVDLQASHASAPILVRGSDRSEKEPNRLKLQVLTCKGSEEEEGGILGGLQVENVFDVTVRNCDLAGPRTLLQDCDVLDFDGNNVRSSLVEIRQTLPKRFGKTKIHNCDFRSPRVVLFAPPEHPGDKKKESLLLDHCWFMGLQDPEKIQGAVILDQKTDPENGVVATFQRISATALKLGGNQDG